jgi:hypothetical protein
MKDFKHQSENSDYDPQNQHRVRGVNESDNLLTGIPVSSTELQTTERDITKPTRYAFIVLGLVLAVYICN